MEGRKFRLNSILEEKVPAVFTACFAPQCFAFGVSAPQHEIHREDSESTQHEALMRMEIDVKKHISAVVQENISLMTEGDEALLSELEASFDEDSTSDLTNLNTIGEETLQDIENRMTGNNTGLDRVKSRLSNLPGAYKQSVKSKFDYYRKHQLFNAGALRPIDENSECEGQVSVKSVSEKHTSTDHPLTTDHEDSKLSTPSSRVSDSAEQNENSTNLVVAQLTMDVEDSKQFTPSSRRSDLAKQILQRRQSQPMTPNRVTVEP
jgi:hypothetical protein